MNDDFAEPGENKGEEPASLLAYLATFEPLDADLPEIEELPTDEVDIFDRD